MSKLQSMLEEQEQEPVGTEGLVTTQQRIQVHQLSDSTRDDTISLSIRLSEHLLE